MFEARIHAVRTPFDGDVGAAIDVARAALLALGFEVQTDGNGDLRAEGPGMQSNKQPALLGVSELHMQVERGSIAAEATLGGVATMRAFIVLFPPGLVLGLALLSYLVSQQPVWHMLWIAAPWLVLSPWMAGSLERRTTRAVDSLVRGMASR